jgi:hypothetical protein
VKILSYRDILNRVVNEHGDGSELTLQELYEK